MNAILDLSIREAIGDIQNIIKKQKAAMPHSLLIFPDQDLDISELLKMAADPDYQSEEKNLEKYEQNKKAGIYTSLLVDLENKEENNYENHFYFKLVKKMKMRDGYIKQVRRRLMLDKMLNLVYHFNSPAYVHIQSARAALVSVEPGYEDAINLKELTPQEINKIISGGILPKGLIQKPHDLIVFDAHTPTHWMCLMIDQQTGLPPKTIEQKSIDIMFEWHSNESVTGNEPVYGFIRAGNDDNFFDKDYRGIYEYIKNMHEFYAHL